MHTDYVNYHLGGTARTLLAQGYRGQHMGVQVGIKHPWHK